MVYSYIYDICLPVKCLLNYKYDVRLSVCCLLYWNGEHSFFALLRSFPNLISHLAFLLLYIWILHAFYLRQRRNLAEQNAVSHLSYFATSFLWKIQTLILSSYPRVLFREGIRTRFCLLFCFAKRYETKNFACFLLRKTAKFREIKFQAKMEILVSVYIKSLFRYAYRPCLQNAHMSLHRAHLNAACVAVL